MAQTKRKRRTKHRGNAAGMVETRGRTGRKPGPAERQDGRAQGAHGPLQQAADRAQRACSAPRSPAIVFVAA